MPISLANLAHYFLIVVAGLGLFLLLGALLGVVGLVSPSITNLVEIANRFLLFLSAVIFPLPSGEYLDLIKAVNPYFVFVDNARSALFGLPLDWVVMGYWSALGVLLLLFLSRRLPAISSDVRDYLV